MSASELLVSIAWLISFLMNLTVASLINDWLRCAELSFLFLQNHPFLKKFEDKDLDLRILVEDLEPPMNIPE